ncbi:exosortase A [Falsiroseomonas tokyonensis]|uniref:Exosortase A n=1 Tax=Falsiroseomonas tokyonensis TaxID=430521 RepID=A0ABV7BPY5_9PROT|nr:exosortase A [Falsiroseomonas tokyonensis]MBU8536714.1 exosortase [Falsiroseomonas tokyonensis]
MNVTLPARPATLQAGGWALPLAGLGLGLLALGLLFRAEVEAAVATWDRSAAYGHCWLVLPIAAWLAWQRRARLVQLRPAPSLVLALPALGAALAWLVAERLGIMEGRQFALVGLAWVLVLAVLGWRIALAMAAPLAYLIFLVPFGEFATPFLQDVTLRMILAGLRLLGIPFYADGLVIEIPAGTFLVAEACAGLRFLIATIAFGALYALVMFRSPGRRLLVLLLAVVVPILANGIRALGIVLLGHHLGSAEAAAADHLIYGWVFFSVVLLLLVLAGLPFRQDASVPVASAPPRQAPARPALALGAAALAVGLGAAGPLAAGRLDAGVPAPQAEAVALAAPEGCEAEGLVLRCAGATASARLLAFAPAANWSAVAAARRLAAGIADDEALTFALREPGVDWQVRQEAGRPMVAVAAWRDGAPAGDGLRARLAQALSALRGGTARPVLLVVELAPDAAARPDPVRLRGLMRALLTAQREGLVPRAATISAGA